MLGKRIINTKVAGGGGCTDIVDNYDPFDGNGVALYQLNGNANDVSGNYNGTATNVTYGAGVFNQAAQFSGSNSFINLGASSQFTASAISFSLWYKPDTVSSIGALLANTNGGSYNLGEFYWYQWNDGKFLISYGQSSTTYVQYFSTSTFSVGTWYFLSFVIDPSATNKFTLYINGAEDTLVVNNQGGTFTAHNVLDNSLQLNMGKRNISGSENYLDGSLDQVRIFNTALTPLEVEALYTEELCICDGTVDTLDILGDGSCIATYQLDGNANDLSGNYSGTPTDVSYGVGEFDLAGVFNGSSSFIDTSISTLSSTFSVSMWINEVSLGSGGFFGNWNSTPNDDMFWRTQSDGSLRINFDGAANQYFGSAGDITANNWHHIVVTFNNGTINVYADGNNKGSTTTINTTFNSGANFYIGDDNSATFFNGSIDQVRIFNKALSAGEVTTLYNETACTKAACTGTTNTLDILGDGSCIATYPLDGSPADLSGNYNGVQTDVTYPQGYFDLAGSFNGSTSGILVPQISGLSGLGSELSASVWVKVNDFNDSFPVILQFLNGTNFNILLNHPNNSLQFGSRDTANQRVYVDYSLINFNNWLHLVLTVKSGDYVKAYIDGQFVGQIAIGTINSGTADNYIGAGALDNFNGQIDQVRIFNKALSAGEVTTLYNETPCN